MNETEKKEARKIWNARYYQKRKAQNQKNEEKMPYVRAKQDSINELLENKEFPEHLGYADYFGRPRQNDPFNPRPMHKGRADNPEAYGEKGVLVCNFCGFPLDKRGRCESCNPSSY